MTRASYAALPKNVQRLVQIAAVLGQSNSAMLWLGVQHLAKHDWPEKFPAEGAVTQLRKNHPEVLGTGNSALTSEFSIAALEDLAREQLAGKWAQNIANWAQQQFHAYHYASPVYRGYCLLRALTGANFAALEQDCRRLSYRLGQSELLTEALLAIPLSEQLWRCFDPSVAIRVFVFYASRCALQPVQAFTEMRHIFEHFVAPTLRSPDCLALAPMAVAAYLQLCLVAGAPMPETCKGFDWPERAWQGAQLLCERRIDEALKQFDLAQKSYRKSTETRYPLVGLFGHLHSLALLIKDDAAAIKQVSAKRKQLTDYEVEQSITHYLDHHQNPKSKYHLRAQHTSIFSLWLDALLACWSDVELAQQFDFLKKIDAAIRLAESGHYNWLADELAGLVPTRYRAKTDRTTIVAMKARQQPWEKLVAAIEQVQLSDRPVSKASAANTESNLEVLFQLGEYKRLTLRLAETRRSKSGKVVCKTILTNTQLKACAARLKDLTQVRLAGQILANSDFYDGGVLSDFLEERSTWELLANYPHAYWLPLEQDRYVLPRVEEIQLEDQHRIEIQFAPLRLEVKRTADQQMMIAALQLQSISDTLSYRIDAGILHVVEMTAASHRVMALLGTSITMPPAAMQRLAELAQTSSQSLRLEFAGDSAKSVRGDARTHVLLQPGAKGLLPSVRVRPFGIEQGPYAAIGEGEKRLAGMIDDELQYAERNFAEERLACDALLAQAPALAALLDSLSSNPDLATDEASLEMLEQLQALEPKPPILWPKGRAMSVLREGKFNIRVSNKRDWLGVEGGLDFDEGVLSLGRLVQLLESSRSRYVQLDDQRYLRVSDQLRKRVQGLAPFVDRKGNVELPLLAGAVLAEHLSLAQNDLLTKAQERLAEAFQLKPLVPNTLQAELRDYQLDGYRWLMQMAHWGVGACLADDMGLGKTVQAIAMLLARATGGAALVVLPTSLFGNWQREALRFAPTLNVHRFDSGSGDALPELGAFDVVLISYGLLAIHIDMLVERKFHTLILDEAQAIKNATTQRAKAACRLQADFRVSLSGTPLENHLGELWSQMRFLNPGLLGSEEQFQSKFATPIERDENPSAKSTLRKLIAPFLLRRTKAQVLAELPEKTEITLNIVPSAAEADLMKGLRAAAVQKISALDSAKGEARFHILAEITRLRRAACHPDLVAPELKIKSAKLEQLLELMEELKSNQHRALIFSQFVDYLSIVRSALDAAGYTYQYLDGATPAKARDERVAAFQSGQGDAFLLSLKAGGVGLNLTAADYVIHLDPWWNPAVEQQASDRAHRIGQTRPVTIYRLVVQGSIEEQILSLHGQKREMIDSMLSERDTAQVLTPEALLALIAGQ
jgi:superfamily II DNA or RNA helicase